MMDGTHWNLTNNYDITLNVSERNSFIQLFLSRKD